VDIVHFKALNFLILLVDFHTIQIQTVWLKKGQDSIKIQVLHKIEAFIGKDEVIFG
jgi:hypothetical protein